MNGRFLESFSTVSATVVCSLLKDLDSSKAPGSDEILVPILCQELCHQYRPRRMRHSSMPQSLDTCFMLCTPLSSRKKTAFFLWAMPAALSMPARWLENVSIQYTPEWTRGVVLLLSVCVCVCACACACVRVCVCVCVCVMDTQM